MPWGEVHTYDLPEYEALVRYVCACEREGQHMPAMSGARMVLCCKRTT